MIGNLEYLHEFVKKHNFDSNVQLRFRGTVHEDNIQSVVFNKKDIKTEHRVSLNDVKYDVDTNLPADVFLRWIEYLDAGGDASYITWMTKMDNHYTPMNIDNSEGEKMRLMVENTINELKKTLGYYD